LPNGTPAGFCPLCTLCGALEEERAARGRVPVIGHPSSVIGIGGPRTFGDYELLEEIARGGMGVVYRARQLSLNRIVALKLMLPFSRPELAARFRAEAETAASLQHPNIVAIHEVGEHEGHPYFSMDYAAGQSLAQVISDQGFHASDFRRLARCLKTVAEAVQYAHEHGIVHRDLKPSNILIDASDQPRITDFGVAKRLPGRSEVASEASEIRNHKLPMDLTLTGQVLGSPNFMAPEQAQGQHAQVGPACDVYALGAILYQALTGRPPFQGQTLTDVLHQVVNVEPVAPRQLNPGIPRDLETLCLRCLEKEPQRRPASAQALADELGRFLDGLPILARPIGRIGMTWRWCRRQPIRAGLIMALLAVTLLGTAGILWQWRQTAAALRKVEKAEREAVDRLWGSYLAQARANRWSGRAGRRFDSLEVLRQAAAIRPSLELRNEAIACFTLTDGRVAQQWPTAAGSLALCDPNCERFAWWNPAEGLAVYRVSDRTELQRLPGSAGPLPVRRLCFSPNGELLAAAYGSPERFQLQVWDLQRAELRCDMVVDGSRQPLAFSPDNRFIVVGDAQGVLHVHDLVRRQEVKQLQVMRSPAQIVFDLGGTRLAVCGVQNPDVQVVDFETGTIFQTLRHPAPAGEPSWHPDGVLLATPCVDFRLRLWDVQSGTVKTLLEGHTGVPASVKFNHAGDLLASSGWDSVSRFWDPILGKEQFHLPACYLPQSSFSSEDSRLPFGHDPIDVGVWQIATGRECRRLGLGGRAFGASFSADGRLLATAHADGARLWDLKVGRPRAFLPARECRSVLFHPDGYSLLLSGWMGLQQWPVQTMENSDALTLRIGPPQTLLRSALEQARWAPDGKTLALTGPQGIQLLELGPPLRVRHQGDHPNATHLALSGNGDWIASGTWKGRGVRVWSAHTGGLVTNLSLGENVAVAFSPDSRWLVTGAPEEYRFWKVGSWEKAQAISRQDAGDMYGSMVFSPDGGMLALVRGRNSDLRLVEADTGREWAALDAGEPHGFSPRGNWLATSEADGLIRLWDLRRIRQQLAALNLDWDAPLGDPEPPFASEKPLRIVVDLEPSAGGQ
jgi:WD40 repeat protein/tRNA A-37 threonylcarbamoyl transferase component Bud32